MGTATITIPDDLDAVLDKFAKERSVSCTQIVEAALREYLSPELRLSSPTDEDEYQPFWVPVLEEKDDRGEPDVSVNHDHYFTEDPYQQQFSDVDTRTG